MAIKYICLFYLNPNHLTTFQRSFNLAWTFLWPTTLQLNLLGNGAYQNLLNLLLYTKSFHCILNISSRTLVMVKKIQKKPVKRPRRISEMERTIAEGKQYTETWKRILKKRAMRPTRTMAEIAKVPIPKRVITKPKHASMAKKIPAKAEVLAKEKGEKTKKIAKTAAIGKKHKKVDPVPAPLIKTSSKKSIGKVTKLKASYKDDLQIPAFGFIDVCFCLDATGSMSSQINQAQQVIEAIIHNIQNKVKTEGLQLRFAIVSYRDHPPQDSSYVTKINDFTDNFETIAYVKTLSAGGGGDEPEAAHDALLDCATKLNWVQQEGTPVLRYIFHILDAPPHGKQFNTGQAHQGCLCGIQTDDVIRQINKKQIHYRMIKARSNPKVDVMQKIFSKKVGDFDSTDIQHARQMNVKVSDMIIHEVLPDYA